MPQSILIIDTNEEKAQPIADFLSDNDYISEIATKLKQIETYLSANNSLIIAHDSENSFSDNPSLIQEIRATFPQSPILFLTKQTRLEPLVNISNSGISKIFDPGDGYEPLLEAVSKYVKKSTGNSITSAGETNSGLVPEPRFLANTSETSKRFYHTLWSWFQKQSHITIQSYAGIESSLILDEVSSWAGSLGKKIAHYQAYEFMDNFMLTPPDPSISPIIAVSNVHTLPEDQCDTFMQHILDSSASSGYHFFYFFDPSKPNMLPTEMVLSLHANMISLPQLRDRPSDVAHYTYRYFKNAVKSGTIAEAPKWTPEAIEIFRTYPWPNNFESLVQTLTAMTKTKPFPEKIDASILCNFLKIDIPDPLPAPLALEEFLVKREATLRQG